MLHALTGEARKHGMRPSGRYQLPQTSVNIKSVLFGHVHSLLFAPVNTRVHGKVLSLSYHAIVFITTQE